MVRRLVISAILLQVSACATMVPPPAVPGWNTLAGTPLTIEDDERKLWQEAKRHRAELAEDKLLVNDAALTGYLESVLAATMGAPLPPEAPKPAVYVMRNAERRAEAAADGGIVITTSTLAIMQNEAQLAGVLGHEVAHFVARHALVRARYAKTSRSMVERMELSREHETYCDRYALARMQAAGYDVRELPRVLELLASDEDKAASWLRHEPFRSHPFTNERIRTLRAITAEAPVGTGRIDADRYELAIAAVLPIAAEVELEAKLLDQAKASTDRLLRIRPNSGRAHYLVAERARLTERDGRRSPSVREAYERAVELAPDDPEAVRALAFLYHGEGDLRRATPLLERYLSLVPDASDRKLIERYLGRSNP
jgi:predicted Zn-dependent protease